MNEQLKVEMFERWVVAWNRGDMGAVTAEFHPEFEWDLTESDIPGETGVYEAAEAYLHFAREWREALGPTQVEPEEAFELDDGRLFARLSQSGTGARSGVDVDIEYVQILSFEDGLIKGSQVFTDVDKGRRAAGLD